MTGAVPFMLAKHPHMTFTNAVFESVSGLTTTGATALTGLDVLPHAILYYRAQLQWLGGMGIIVLAVAILPMLGVGGMQLYRAETPGPMKDAKLTPRITETAKALWYIYLGLTVACALAYWLAGMSPFDAIAHSFDTLSTGGFSTHDLSMGYFHSPLIEMIAVVFMVLAGANFSLHFMAWRAMSLRPYTVDSEVKAYLIILASVAAITAGYLYGAGAGAAGQRSPPPAARHGARSRLRLGGQQPVAGGTWSANLRLGHLAGGRRKAARHRPRARTARGR
jgi:trk system potassium uptake protein TrkH